MSSTIKRSSSTVHRNLASLLAVEHFEFRLTAFAPLITISRFFNRILAALTSAEL